jgi:hypothetical protein
MEVQHKHNEVHPEDQAYVLHFQCFSKWQLSMIPISGIEETGYIWTFVVYQLQTATANNL